MPAPRRSVRMRLVTGPTSTGTMPTILRAKKARQTSQKIRAIRIPKTNEKKPVYGPSALERASVPLAAYALRQNRMNRRSSLPTNTREMIDVERNRIRGLQTPKELKNYLNGLERVNEKYLKLGKQKGEIVWKQDERKSIRVGKKKGSAMKQVSLTNYGKFEKLYMDPAGRKWSDMTQDHQKRMAEYVVRTMDKYHASTQQNLPDGTYRRMRQNEVLHARVPELQKMIATIQKRIDSDTYVWNQMKKAGNDPVMTNEMEKSIHGMKNRMSILNGSLQLVEKGTFSTPLDRNPRKKTSKKSLGYETIPNERALIVRPEQKTDRPTIPFPGAEAIEQAQRGGVPASVIKEWVRQRTREKTLKPLTQEDVRKAVERRDLEFRRMGLKHQIAQLERDIATARQRGDTTAERIAAQRLEGSIRREMGLDPRPEPVERENGPVFGKQGGVRRWVDRYGTVHRLFVSRPTPPTRKGTELLPASGPTPEDYDRMYGGPTGVGFQTSSKPTWRERTRERWKKIGRATKELGKRMFRRKKETEK